VRLTWRPGFAGTGHGLEGRPSLTNSADSTAGAHGFAVASSVSYLTLKRSPFAQRAAIDVARKIQGHLHGDRVGM
jgi:hypothetical protein